MSKETVAAGTAPNGRKKAPKPAGPAQRVIKTAEEWEKILASHERQAAREQREYDKKVAMELSVEDLRDEAIAIIRNELGRGDGAFEIVHGRMGPHPSTLHLWENKKIKRPQLPKLRAAVAAVGWDLTYIRKNGRH